MVKQSGNKSSNKGKNNNIGKMFIKRENNNTWIMLGLVLVLCVAVYYYVTSKNNDRTEEKFENSLLELYRLGTTVQKRMENILVHFSDSLKSLCRSNPLF